MSRLKIYYIVLLQMPQKTKINIGTVRWITLGIEPQDEKDVFFMGTQEELDQIRMQYEFDDIFSEACGRAIAELFTQNVPLEISKWLIRTQLVTAIQNKITHHKEIIALLEDMIPGEKVSSRKE